MFNIINHIFVISLIKYIGDVMKKLKNYKLYLIFFSLCLILTMAFVLSSCGKRNIEIFRNNISEARYNFYTGEVGEYKVSLTCGVRESDFKLNGYHTTNVEFGVLTIVLPSDVEYTGSATYKIEYGNKTTSGNLEQNPFDFSLMADIGFIIKDIDEIKVTFKMGSITKFINLHDVTKNFNYNYDSALELFVNENYKELKSFVDGNELKAEVYIKIMYNNEIDSNYYYLIRVIGRQGNVLSGIVNPINGEILAVTSDKL